MGILRVEESLARHLKGDVSFFILENYQFREVTDFKTSRNGEKISTSQVQDLLVSNASRFLAFNRSESAEKQLFRLMGLFYSIATRPFSDKKAHEILFLCINVFRVPMKYARKLSFVLRKISIKKRAKTKLLQVPENYFTNSIKHPFAPGDIVLTLGLDWDSNVIELLSAINEDSQIKVIVWVYDLIALEYPEVISNSQHRAKLFKHFAMIAHLAIHIVFISKSSRNDFFKFCNEIGVQKPNGSVVTLAAEIDHGGSTDKKVSMEDLGISGKFILSVGTLEPRKNYWTLIHAMFQVPHEVDIQLVIVGRHGWGTADLLSYVAHKRSSRVRVLTNISDETLQMLYQNAAAYFSASLAEGFNLPVLEAQQAGLPLFISNVPAHIELFPESEFIDVFDVFKWSKKMVEVANGEIIQKCVVIPPKGWDNYTLEVMQIIQRYRS